ncbi:lysoplasmalogenase family protein [Robertkochia flava]|uniref:lysoplasmalogenase family protein n=1 Tax=Robertkochia flava TaxID=3447986 RepID=UPI001CCE0D1E|nr:lysoplasmalogenase family protein [Robertkochia marina]
MQTFLQSSKWFTAVFVVILFFDIILSNMEGLLYFSLVTKILLLGVLLNYFMLRSRGQNAAERVFVILAIVSFSLGELFMMITNNLNIIVAGFLLLLAAKLLYSCAFVFKVKLDIDRLLPYLVFVTLYSLTIIYFLYEVPEHVPAYIFLVITLIMLKLAYLRYERVDWNSFITVLAGAGLILASETILVFDRSFSTSQLSGVMIVLLYGLSQYLMVQGLILEPGARNAA